LRISDRYSGAGNGGAIGRLIAATDPMSDRFAVANLYLRYLG
jgi:hypothetical protein